MAEEIRFEWLPYSAEELIAIGQRELEWCEGEMKVNSRAMGLGKDWKAALARVKSDYAPPGEQDELIARIGREATDFVCRRKLVERSAALPGELAAGDDSARRAEDAALRGLLGPGNAGGLRQRRVDQDKKLMVMRGNNRHFMRLVTPHELIPGHHLQGFYGQRYNTYRQLFGTPFYVEGWALYWELRLFDLGWAQTPEDRIGMLFWRMHRAARDPGLAPLPAWKDDARRNGRFSRSAGRPRADGGHQRSATLPHRTAAVPGRLSPRRPSAYSLHNELVGGGKMSESQFHVAVLRRTRCPSSCCGRRCSRCR